MKTITCRSCGKEHDEAFVDGHVSNQGKGCSSEAYDGIVRGFDGSEFANESFLFGEKVPNWVQEGTICDICVNKLLKMKFLRRGNEQDLNYGM